ncbi:MAG: O-antigen ligase domain-containing protein, partial [Calditrichaeota bacterium]
MLNSLPKARLLQSVLFGAIGVFVGIAVTFAADFPQKFLIVFVAGLSFPFAALLIRDIRRFFLAATVISVPVHFDINFMHQFEQQAGASTAGINLTDLFVLGLLLVWLIEIASQERPYTLFFSKLTIPAIIHFEAVALSMLWAPRLDLAFMEVFRMFKVFILYFILINHIRDKKDVRLVVWVLIGSLAFEGIISSLQAITGGRLGLDFLGEAPPDLDGDSSLWRVMGTLGHPNKLATFMESLLLLPFGLFLVEKSRRNRLICLIVFIMGCIILILTGTRGAWIGFMLAFLLFMFFVIKSRHFSLRSFLLPAALVLILLPTITALFWGMVEERVFGDDYGSAASRVPMFKIALNVIAA